VADLSLRKLVSNPSPQIGQSFEYNLIVKNDGPDFATNVQVRDILPTGLAFISSDYFTNNNGVLLSKTIAKIEKGKADTLRFFAKIQAWGNESPTTITNRAEISKSDQLDPDSQPNNGLLNGEDDEASVIVGGQSADLSLTKDVDNPTPNVGDIITYLIKVKNSSVSAATNVQVQDYLPRGLQFVATAGWDWSMTNDSLLKSKIIPIIAPNTTVTLTVKASVTALAMAQSSSVKNYAEVSKSDQFDPDSQPNTGYQDGQDDTDGAEIKIQYSDLSLTKTASNRKPSVGETIDYTLTVTNDGINNATNVQVQDILPKGLQYLSGSGWLKSGDTLRNTIPLIMAGTSRSVIFTAKILTPGGIINEAEISKADQYDPDSPHGNGTGKGEDDEAGVLVNGEQADLSLKKTVSNQRPNVGDTLTYAISVHNSGPDAATNVQVKDKLPKEIQFIESDDFDNLISVLWADVKRIGKDSTVILTFKAKVTNAKAFTNYAEISKSDQYDPDSQPNTGNKDGQDDTDKVTVKPRIADLSLEKLADRKTANIGTNITFKLVVKNAGPDSATHVVVKDVLPTGLEFISSQHFTKTNGGVLTSKAIKVAPNTVDSLFFVALVTKEGLIINKAEIVKSDVFDPNSIPNSGTEDGEDDNARITVGGEQADLSLVKTVSDPLVNVGKTTTFTIKINNAGPSVATNVQVKDYLPKGLIFVSSTDFLKSTDAIFVSRNVPQIGVNQTVSLTMVAMVTKDFYEKSNPSNTLTNRAEITKSDQFDSDSQPNTGTEDSQDDQSRATITVPTSDLSLKKTVSNTTITIGSEVTYSITVTNDGTDNATNIVVKDYLPKGLMIVKLNDFTISKTSDTLSLKIGRINAGDSKVYVYTAILTDAQITNLPLVNKAEITKSDQFDPDSEHGNGIGKGEDDEASATIGGELADLEIKKTVSNNKPNVGENFTYTISVKNNGPNLATNVEVKDFLPMGLTIINSKDFTLTGTNLTAKIDSIKVNDSKLLTIIAKLLPTADSRQRIINRTSITKSDQIDPNPKNNKDSASIGGQSADLSLRKLVNRSIANLGEQVTYKLIVCNKGPDTATNVVVRDVLPASLGFVASADFTRTGSVLISRKILKIAPNNADTLIFIAEIKDKCMIVNCAEIFKSDQSDPDSQVGNGTNNGEDDEACAMLNVDQADLSLTKGAECYGNTPNVGDTISYVLEVRNAGPGIATGVQVSDILPNGIQFISTEGFTLYGNTVVSKTIDSIKVGSSVKLKFKVKITGVGGEEVANTIINRAEITKADQFDPDSQPNTGTADGQDDVGYFALMPQMADLSLKKTVNRTDVSVGDTLIYRLELNNAGPSVATNVELSDLLPDGLQLVESNNGILVGNLITFKAASIEKGGNEVFEYKGVVKKEGKLINTAQVSKSDQFDPDSTPNNGKSACTEDDEASCAVQVKLRCDKTIPYIIISKTNIFCQDSTLLTVLGCKGTVHWSDGQKGNTIIIRPTIDVSITATCVYSNTCVSDVSKAVKITVNNPTAPVILTNRTQVCGGDSVRLSSTGCAGITVWSNGKIGNSISEKLVSTASFTAICSVGVCNSPRSNELTIKTGIDKPLIICGKERLCLGESEVLKAYGCEGGKVTWSDGQIGQAILVKPTKTQYQFTAICEVGTCKSEPSNPAYYIVTECGKDSIKVVQKPMLALCKEARVPVLIEGKTYDITYDFRWVNVGNVDFDQIQVLDNLADVFTDNGAKILKIKGLKSDSGLVVNPDYDGQTNNRLLIETQSRLLAGKVASIQFTVRVDFTTAKVDTFYNSATGVAKAGKEVVQDLSNDGFDINPDGNNDPTDDSKPTPIYLYSLQKPENEPDEIFIPEGFSPNGDGVNDLFVLDLYDKTLTINLQVYNRWGGLVYAQENYQNNWDGNANQGANLTGKTNLPDGTYFYLVRLSNGKEFIRIMTLLR
jgi:hypothetical protein